MRSPVPSTPLRRLTTRGSSTIAPTVIRGIEAGVRVLEDDLHLAAQAAHVLAAGRQHVDAVEAHGARGGLHQAEHAARGGRLAAAGLPHQPEGLAGPQLEADAVDGAHGADLPVPDAAPDREVLDQVLDHQQGAAAQPRALTPGAGAARARSAATCGAVQDARGADGRGPPRAAAARASAHSGRRARQRGWNGQPEGGWMSEGGLARDRHEPPAARRRRAWGSSRAGPTCRGAAGRRRRPRPAPPRRSARRTSPRRGRPCAPPRRGRGVISRIPDPSARCCSCIRSRIWAWMVTSSAVVGSSAMSRAGRQARAMAIITRWRWPPESWCG